MSTANERFNSAFWGALVAAAAFFTVMSLLVALTDRAVVIGALNVEAPDFVAVSEIRRSTQYTVDVTSNTCYVMLSNFMGTSFAPVDCAAIGVDSHSISRTGQ